ncbi:hypothetical protein Sango_1057500 [Sesamum angolense]|uniref:Uncharacterized protein n=1 Tax=Sesamum angolense TaxID=2727404 RepID=A0AAE1X1F5_9LAMI|nr:hypothetical protein Sango_1057500 [Sesamum angolense]
MRKYGMKLNPTKCTFGVRGGKFLGYMVTKRGMEASPEKIEVVLHMLTPKFVKDTEKLAGRMASLIRFISKATNKGLPFFKILRNVKNFDWTPECDKAFNDLKEYLSFPPILAKPIERITIFVLGCD